MTVETAAQQAIYSVLSAGMAQTVYDHVPGLPAGMPDANFPFVVIGDDTLVPWEADDILGAQATVTVHFWSRYQGAKEIKEMMGAAYGLLHRQSIPVPGYSTVDCLWEFSTTAPESGDYRHGVQRYRLTFSKET